MRDVTQIFANRAELMPPGETTDEHQKWQAEEAALVETDRSKGGANGGLFRGCFRAFPRRIPRSFIRDVEDGVNRCPRCTWELEDGLCGSCGYPSAGDSGDQSTESEGQEFWDEVESMDIDTRDGIMEAFAEEELMLNGRDPYEQDDYGSEFAFSVRRRDENGDAIDLEPYPADYSLPDTEHPYESLSDSPDGDSENDEAGSLNDFIVDEEGDRAASATSSARSSYYQSEEPTEAEDVRTQYSDNDVDAQDSDNPRPDEALAANPPWSSSDEGLILPSTRRSSRRSTAPNHTTARSHSSVLMPGVHNGMHVRPPARISQSRRNPSHRVKRTGSRGRRARDSVEASSDSESPIPLQRPRRRQLARNHISSDRESVAEVSSGTATVGRQSPQPALPRNRNPRWSPRARDDSTPIVIGSSPARSADADGSQLAIPEAFSPSAAEPSQSALPVSTHQSNDLYGQSWHNSAPRERESNNVLPIWQNPAATGHESENSPENAATRRTTSRTSPPAQQRHRARLQSPRQARSRLHPSAHRPTRSPRELSRSEGEERFEQGFRDRRQQKVERKAERRRQKEEREQRRREEAGRSASPGPSRIGQEEVV